MGRLRSEGLGGLLSLGRYELLAHACLSLQSSRVECWCVFDSTTIFAAAAILRGWGPEGAGEFEVNEAEPLQPQMLQAGSRARARACSNSAPQESCSWLKELGPQARIPPPPHVLGS